MALERGCNSAEEDGGEEREKEDDCRAMRVGPKTRCRQRSEQSHAKHNRAMLSIHKHDHIRASHLMVSYHSLA
jgi:hypothetical protein